MKLDHARGRSALLRRTSAYTMGFSLGLIVSAYASAGMSVPPGVPVVAALATPADEPISNNRFIIKYKAGTHGRRGSASIQNRLDRAAPRLPSKATHLRRMSSGADVIQTERMLDADENEVFMRQLRTDPEVTYVEVDAVMHTATVPNDPQYYMQWGFNAHAAGIHVEKAWDVANGAGVTVAVLDTGVTRHGDLDANVLPGIDILNRTVAGDGTNPGITVESCQAASWHGTHVAGTVAAITANGKGVAGTAWGARILPVRVLNACGTGYVSDIADGIAWAAGDDVPGARANAHPAQVINMSLGGGGPCQATFQQAIDRAMARGVTVVAAAMNESRDMQYFSPANCNGVMAVAATNLQGQRASFRTMGR